MENRFGFKDLVISTLLLAIIVSIWISMKQRDREWEVLQRIADQSSEQQGDMSRIEQALANGVTVSNGGSGGQDYGQFNGRSAFDWIKKIEAKPDYARGDWFVENLPTHVPKITPLTYKDIYGQYVVYRVEESLCYRDPFTLEFVPLLATSWQSTNNVPAWQAYVDQRLKAPITQDEIVNEDACPGTDKPDDRKKYIDRRMKEGMTQEDVIHEPDCPVAQTITFQLRKGVQFSDGVPFTADDVVFTYDYINNPKVDAPRDRSAVDRVKAVRKINDYEVAFDIREPYYDSLFMVSSEEILPKHFYEKYSIDDFNNSTGLLMGEGPYRLENVSGVWTPSEKIVLVRNERYWGEPPPFDRIVFTQVEEESVQTTMFKNGELDYITQLAPDQFKSMIADTALAKTSQHLAYDYSLYGYYYVGWNQIRNGKSTVFADKRVRQALTMLIDRQKICDQIYLGYAKVATGPFAASNPQHDPDLKPMPYDPEKAKGLLASLGFSDRNGTGVLVNAAGQELRFKLSYPSKNETINRLALQIKDNLAQAGIAMEPDPQEWPIIMQRLDNRDFDAIMLGWSASIEDDLYQIFHSSQIAGDGDNSISYSDPDLDAAIVAARTDLDPKTRMPLWQKCERIIAEDQPCTFLINRQELMFADKRIQNIEPSTLGLNYVELFIQPIPWYVPANQRKWTK